MSTEKSRTLHAPPDPDDTAEMPGLPPLDSATDSWAALQLPEPAARAQPQQEVLSTPRSPPQASRPSPPQAPAPPPASTAALDDMLRLHQEQVDGLRASLAASTVGRRELQTRIELLQAEKSALADSHARDRRKAEQRLREQEQRLREQQVRELREQEHRLIERHAHELGEQQQQLQDMLARQDAAAPPVDEHKARLERSLAHGAAELAALQRRAESQHEALRHAEGMRNIYDAMLREREQRADELAAQLAELRERQQRELAAARAQQLTVAEPQPQHPDLSAELAAAQAAAREAQQRAEQLTSEVADHVAVAAALHERLRGAEAANETMQCDLLAAEALLRTRDTELQQAAARLERLESVEALPDTRARLLVRTAGDSGIVHVLGRHTTIGRTPDNDLQVEAEFISRHHAVVLTQDDGTVIEDLDSTNGVYVNGERVTRQLLQVGDLVTLGKTTFRFLIKPADE